MKENWFTGVINKDGQVVSFDGALYKIKRFNQNELSRYRNFDTIGLVVDFIPQPSGKRWAGVRWAETVAAKEGRCAQCGKDAKRLYWDRGQGQALCEACKA